MTSHASFRRFRTPNVHEEAGQGAGSELVSPDLDRVFSEDDIRHAFQTFDLDKNNSIGVSELRHVLSLIGESVTDDEVDRMIQLADTDGMGQVSYDGFYRLFSPDSASPEPVRQQEVVPTVKEADTDDVPIVPVTTQEPQVPIIDIMHALSQKIHVTPAFIRSLYKKCHALDVDKTGRLSYVQMEQAMDVPDSHIVHTLLQALDRTSDGTFAIKSLLVCLLMHTDNKVTLLERVRISFSLMRSNAHNDNAVDREQLEELLHVFFLPYDADDSRVRAEGVLQATSGTSDVTFDQFMDLVISEPRMVLPPQLASGIVA
jgi:Ca2+-binding EF-hand superfamily protein